MEQKEAENNGSDLRVFCSECGHELEPGADFCYICGSLRTFAVNGDNRVLIEKGVCPFCGNKNAEDAGFCDNCGRGLGEYEFTPVRKTPLSSKDYLIMALAFIPGAFNIFGLGHLLLKKYSRGIMYLLISVVLIYLIFCSPELGHSTYFLLQCVGFVIYLKQSFEVLYEIYNRRE